MWNIWLHFLDNKISGGEDQKQIFFKVPYYYIVCLLSIPVFKLKFNIIT